jgi:hypothetical protein
MIRASSYGTAKTSSGSVGSILRIKLAEKLLLPVTSRLDFSYLNHISSSNIPKHNFYKDADILNFHNLHKGYFNYLAIPTLTEAILRKFDYHPLRFLLIGLSLPLVC